MTFNNTEVIDYESLIAEYNASLTTALRGFRPAISFLETWVPDEDIAKSLLNLVEAAEASGLSSVAVFLAPNTALHLDLPRLLESLTEIGTPEVRSEYDGILLFISSLRGNAPLAKNEQF